MRMISSGVRIAVLRFSGKGNQGKAEENSKNCASHEDFVDSGVPKKFTNEIQSILEFETGGTMAWKDVESSIARIW